MVDVDTDRAAAVGPWSPPAFVAGGLPSLGAIQVALLDLPGFTLGMVLVLHFGTEWLVGTLGLAVLAMIGFMLRDGFAVPAPQIGVFVGLSLLGVWLVARFLLAVDDRGPAPERARRSADESPR